MKRFVDYFVIVAIIVVIVMIILSFKKNDSYNKIVLAKTIEYVQDKNGIVYAIGYGNYNQNAFAMTVIPSSELGKIPEDQIKKLSDFLEKD